MAAASQWSVHVGPKIIRIFAQPVGPQKKNLRYWYTPDKRLFHYWRNELDVLNLPEFRQFLNFQLH